MYRYKTRVLTRVCTNINPSCLENLDLIKSLKPGISCLHRCCCRQLTLLHKTNQK